MAKGKPQVREGWRCPVCGKVNAPDVTTCPTNHEYEPQYHPWDCPYRPYPKYPKYPWDRKRIIWGEC